MSASVRELHEADKAVMSWRPLAGASLGSMFEWYDFFMYALLASHFSEKFFPRGSSASGLLFALATFGAGFIVRPLGALIFGPIGDRAGRKLTFLITTSLMGVATAAVGLLPTFEDIGWWAPILLVTLRLIQGLSVGGEYGGAATYLGEHAPPHRRGALTGWLQTTVTGGQLLALLVIMSVQTILGHERFDAWGWRLPFLFSLVLLVVSVYIRFGLEESPVFREIQQAKRTSKSPLTESLSRPGNLRRILASIVLCAGQGVIGYIGALYPVIFLTSTIHLDHETVNVLAAIAVCVSIPFQPAFGWLSDRIGRKWLMLSACLIAAAIYMPAFNALLYYGDSGLAAFQSKVTVVITSDECATHLFVTPQTPLSSCDRVRAFLTSAGVNHTLQPKTTPGVVTSIGPDQVEGSDPARLRAALLRAGYPDAPDSNRTNYPMLVVIMSGFLILGALIFGPLAAFLVEQFPPEIRYTSIGISYNFGTGWFGGMTPFVVTAISIASGNIFGGLWAPIIFVLLVFTIGAICLRESQVQST